MKTVSIGMSIKKEWQFSVGVCVCVRAFMNASDVIFIIRLHTVLFRLTYITEIMTLNNKHTLSHHDVQYNVEQQWPVDNN